jgi:hypothetical protein
MTLFTLGELIDFVALSSPHIKALEDKQFVQKQSEALEEAQRPWL